MSGQSWPACNATEASQMGEELRSRPMHATKRAALAVLAGLTMVSWGCASAGSGDELVGVSPVSTGTRSEATVSAPAPQVAEIERLEVFDMAPGARVDISAGTVLTWTTYRDSEGHLVIDLPNARPGQGVVNQVFDRGVVSGIRIASAGIPSRPLTRMVILTREASEHRLVAEGGTLRLDLVPIGQQFPELTTPVAIAAAGAAPVAAPATVAEPVAAPSEPERLELVATEPMEPITASRLEAEPLSEPVATAPAPTIARQAPPAFAGTPENPLLSEPPSPGLAASSLLGVAVARPGSIRIDGDGEFAYSTFRLEDPERFVIDLDGVVNRSNRSALIVEDGALTRVRVSQFRSQPDPVSRVVFDLTETAIPSIERSPEGLTVSFGESRAAEAAPAYSMPPSGDADLRHVEPEVVAEVVTPAPAPVAEPPRARPEVALAPVEEPLRAAPESERPRVVEAFEAQDVQAPAPSPDAPRVTPAVVAGQTVISGQKEYTGEPISMSVRDADVREVLRTFAQLSGLNVVIQPGVRGTVTVELERVPWDQALDQILKINGLGYELEGNIMRIAPLNVLEQEARRAQAIAEAQALSLPLRTVVKRLSYSRAGEIASLLQRGGGGVMSRRGTVIVDGRTNTLIIKEIPTYIDTVLAVIETLDTPEPQVMIEARIIETTKQFSRSLGISWGFDAVADQAHGNSTGLQFPYSAEGSGGVNLLTGGANGFIDLSLGNVLDTFTLDARLQAAEAEGLINVLSAPKIATLNNNAAQIQSGVQIPVQTVANNTVSVQFVNATLKLNVTPHVTAEGTVLLDIQVQKREPQFAFQVAGSPSAPIATKDARTRVIVRDGGTTVIGGIYRVTTDQGVDRVPGLSNVPLLGNLFKNRRSRTDNDELLIFITPRVMKL